MWTNGFHNPLAHTHFNMFVDKWTSANKSPDLTILEVESLFNSITTLYRVEVMTLWPRLNQTSYSQRIRLQWVTTKFLCVQIIDSGAMSKVRQPAVFHPFTTGTYTRDPRSGVRLYGVLDEATVVSNKPNFYV